MTPWAWSWLMTIKAKAEPIVAELERECGHRRRVYPSRVQQHRMNPEEADYQLAIFEELCGQVKRHLASPDWTIPPGRFSWSDKVRAVEREIAYRERLYPEQCRTGRLLDADADRQLALLRMVHDLLWRHLFTWTGPDGADRDARLAAASAHLQEVERQDAARVQPELNL